MNEKVIPVFMNVDDQYTVPTYIAIYSMLYNHKSSEILHVYLLTAGDISEKNAVLLQSLEDMFPKLKFRILTVGSIYESVEINCRHISTATLYRLMIPRIVEEQLSEEQIDKCIFLDCDLVVEGDISELYQYDMEGYYIGGVPDMFQLSYLQEEKCSQLEIPSIDRYINAGVLLLNLKKLRKTEGLCRHLEEEGYLKNYPLNDQDVINSVLYDGIKRLPSKFNMMPYYVYDRPEKLDRLYGKEDVLRTKKEKLVIHYITKYKPWLYKTSILSGKWWKYVRMQNRRIRCEYIRPFTKANRLPFREHVREFLFSLIIYTRVVGMERDDWGRRRIYFPVKKEKLSLAFKL